MDDDEDTLELEKSSQVNLLRSLLKQVNDVKTDVSLEIPYDVWSLLDIGPCTIAQKKWLMWFCGNRGNYIRACSAIELPLADYREWRNPATDEIANIKFQEAIQEVELAYLAAGETTLIELAGEKSATALSVYLKAKHPDYKPKDKNERPVTPGKGGVMNPFQNPLAGMSKERKAQELNML